MHWKRLLLLLFLPLQLLLLLLLLVLPLFLLLLFLLLLFLLLFLLLQSLVLFADLAASAEQSNRFSCSTTPAHNLPLPYWIHYKTGALDKQYRHYTHRFADMQTGKENTFTKAGNQSGGLTKQFSSPPVASYRWHESVGGTANEAAPVSLLCTKFLSVGKTSNTHKKMQNLQFFQACGPISGNCSVKAVVRKINSLQCVKGFKWGRYAARKVIIGEISVVKNVKTKNHCSRNVQIHQSKQVVNFWQYSTIKVVVLKIAEKKKSKC